MFFPSLFSVLTVFLLSLLLTTRLRPHLPIDTPLRLGGFIVFIVFLFCAAIATTLIPPLFFVAMAVIMLVGLIDDVYGLSPVLKLCGQLAAAAILVMAVGINNPVVFCVMVVGIAFLQNAINMMDGVDGLAGGYAAIVFSLFGLWVMPYYIVLVAGLVGFLLLNVRSRFVPRAKITLGDTGTMTIGLIIGWVIIVDHPFFLAPNHSLLFFLWVLALPLWDSMAVILSRLRDGKNPMKGDKRHLHHLLLARGCEPQRVTLVLLAYSIVLCNIGLIPLWVSLPTLPLIMLWALGLVAHCVFTQRALGRLS